jgi:hypothetical protein
MHISLSSLVSQEYRKTYKRERNCSAVPQSKAQLQDHHSLHLLFNDMLHKSLVSLIAAFAVATGVAASVTPVARGGSDCNTGTESCCNTITNIDNPIIAELASLADIALPVDAAVPIGITCLGIASANQW